MKILLIFCVFVLTTNLFGKLNTIVSILPQKAFIKAIGKDKIDVEVMVKQGASPHTYEPKPSQMIKVAKASLYFSIGVEFEHIWLDKFKNINKNMNIIDISNNIAKLPTKEHHDGNDKEDLFDPHIWTAPSNIKIIAKNILIALIKYDKINKDYYTKNYKQFIKQIEKTDNEIKNIFKSTTKYKQFVVFHPSWQYFAKEYNIHQISIQIGSKSVKLKNIKYIIKKIKEQNIKTIFVSPEFSNKISKQIAKQLNIKIVKISVLNPKWDENLIKFAQEIIK